MNGWKTNKPPAKGVYLVTYADRHLDLKNWTGKDWADVPEGLKVIAWMHAPAVYAPADIEQLKNSIENAIERLRKMRDILDTQSSRFLDAVERTIRNLNIDLETFLEYRDK